MSRPRKDSFDMESLGAEAEGDDSEFVLDDEESKRLREDAMIDKFKLVEKYLMFWY